MILSAFEDFRERFGAYLETFTTYMDPILGLLLVKLTLAPSGDEILPVSFQGSQINAFPIIFFLHLPSSVPLGMESIL